MLLHVRPYRESSAIVQFFTRDVGRIAGVARGSKRRHGTNLQVFTVGMLVVSGRSNLVTIVKFEQARSLDLHGEALVAGFYVLELITRLLDERQAEPAIFDATHLVLAKLASGLDVQRCLRPFEVLLLEELGYGVDFCHDAEDGHPIEADRDYVFRNDFGFVQAGPDDRDRFGGAALLAIASDDYSDPKVTLLAKKIMRHRLAPLLGPKPLVSRKMIMSSQKK